MSTDATETTITETPPEPVEAPVAATLAEHKAQFPAEPKRGAPPAEAVTERRTRHRAKSQQASPEDIKQIDELTKQLRETEKAIQIERKDGESDRAYELRKRVEIAKRATQSAAVPAQPAAPVRQPSSAISQPQSQPTEFTEKEPQLADFANEPDPYMAWQRKLASYDRRKEAFEDSQKSAQATHKANEEKFWKEINQGISEHDNRVVAHMQAHPEDKAVIDAEAAKPPNEQIMFTPAIAGAVQFHPRGPELVVALLRNPDLADELFLLTNGRPVGDPRTDPLVASVQRRLLSRVPDVKTGAPATPRPSTIAPRPPTPVRTAPQTPREKAPSEPAGSLAEHRRRFPMSH